MKAEEALQLHGVIERSSAWGVKLIRNPRLKKLAWPQPRPFHRVLGPLPFLSFGVLAGGTKG
jgi:hypothetical protein